MDSVTTILISLCSTFFGALFVYLFSFPKEKKEKIWLRKHDAYTEIIDSLHEVYIWALEEAAARYPNLASRSSEQLKELSLKKDKALDILSKYSHVGVLIISNKASERLKEVLEKYSSERSFYINEIAMQEDSLRQADHYNDIQKLFSNTISCIKDIAQEDLGIKKH